MSLGSVTSKNQCLAGTYGDNKGATAPSSVQFRLYNGNPTAGGVELVGNGYALVLVANTTANMGTPAGGQLGPILIEFPQANGAGWGTPDYWGLTDTSGNLYDYGPISAPILVGAGLILILAVTLVAA